MRAYTFRRTYIGAGVEGCTAWIGTSGLAATLLAADRAVRFMAVHLLRRSVGELEPRGERGPPSLRRGVVSGVTGRVCLGPQLGGGRLNPAGQLGPVVVV